MASKPIIERSIRSGSAKARHRIMAITLDCLSRYRGSIPRGGTTNWRIYVWLVQGFFKEVNYTLRKKRKGNCKRSKTGGDHVFNASKHKHNGPLTFRYFVCSRCGKLGGLYKVE